MGSKVPENLLESSIQQQFPLEFVLEEDVFLKPLEDVLKKMSIGQKIEVNIALKEIPNLNQQLRLM